LERAKSWISLAQALSQPEGFPVETENAEGETIAAKTRAHERFIFYWIAFNCLYGRRYYDGFKADQETDIQKFLKKVKMMSQFSQENKETILEDAVSACHTFGRKLVLDRFLDDRYWRRQPKVTQIIRDSEEKWRQAEKELDMRKDCGLFLELTFDRLRVLRNQIMHGCASHGLQSKGYKSLSFGVRFLEIMLPAFFMLTERHGEHVKWEKAPYPRKDHVEHPW
jgi:hypothetical protein